MNNCAPASTKPAATDLNICTLTPPRVMIAQTPPTHPVYSRHNSVATLTKVYGIMQRNIGNGPNASPICGISTQLQWPAELAQQCAEPAAFIVFVGLHKFAGQLAPVKLRMMMMHAVKILVEHEP
jgi:hypothetical protein